MNINFTKKYLYEGFLNKFKNYIKKELPSETRGLGQISQKPNLPSNFEIKEIPEMSNRLSALQKADPPLKFNSIFDKKTNQDVGNYFLGSNKNIQNLKEPDVGNKTDISKTWHDNGNISNISYIQKNKKIITNFDKNGKKINSIILPIDKNGNTKYPDRSEYRYNKNGDLINLEIYKDGKLIDNRDLKYNKLTKFELENLEDRRLRDKVLTPPINLFKNTFKKISDLEQKIGVNFNGSVGTKMYSTAMLTTQLGIIVFSLNKLVSYIDPNLSISLENLDNNYNEIKNKKCEDQNCIESKSYMLSSIDKLKKLLNLVKENPVQSTIVGGGIVSGLILANNIIQQNKEDDYNLIGCESIKNIKEQNICKTFLIKKNILNAQKKLKLCNMESDPKTCIQKCNDIIEKNNSELNKLNI